MTQNHRLIVDEVVSRIGEDLGTLSQGDLADIISDAAEKTHPEGVGGSTIHRAAENLKKKSLK